MVVWKAGRHDMTACCRRTLLAMGESYPKFDQGLGGREGRRKGRETGYQRLGLTFMLRWAGADLLPFGLPLISVSAHSEHTTWRR